MTGTITRTASGYALQTQIASTSDGMTRASYSGTCTAAELDNLTGIRRASLELLGKMNVQLTEKAKQELSGAGSAASVNAQTTLAKGITAQKQGTEVAALSYYYQAAAFDTSLLEAAGRASVMNADISSGNIGSIGGSIRNDIQWRRSWVERLTETERYFDSFFKASSLPYTLFYSTDIKQGAINYQSETATLSIDVNLHPSGVWAGSHSDTLIIPASLWGDPVTGIVRGKSYDYVTSVTIPNSVTYIGTDAFKLGYGYGKTTIMIGANVDIGFNYYSSERWGSFVDYYNRNGRKAGVYECSYDQSVNSNAGSKSAPDYNPYVYNWNWHYRPR
jgi:hypothetical protein